MAGMNSMNQNALNAAWGGCLYSMAWGCSLPRMGSSSMAWAWELNEHGVDGIQGVSGSFPCDWSWTPAGREIEVFTGQDEAPLEKVRKKRLQGVDI